MAMTSTTPRRPAITRPTRWAAGIVMGAVLVGGLPASAQSPISVADAQREPGLGPLRSVSRPSGGSRRAAARAWCAPGPARRIVGRGERDRPAARPRPASRCETAPSTRTSPAATDARLVALLGSDRVEDASARSAILLNQAETAADAADAFQRLKDENDPEVVALATAVDDVERRIDEATSDLLQAAALEADAERVLTQARAAAARLRRQPPSGSLPPTTRPAGGEAGASPAAAVAATPLDDGWAKLVECESGGDYTIVSATGRYRGAYQFDQRTWESVGGTGDPAAATPAEQDLRARILYERRGARAWPHCGKHLSVAAR